MYLSRPVLEILWSLSYLSARYPQIARVSLISLNSPPEAIDRSKGLPNYEIVVVVINDSGDTTIGIDLQVFRILLLLLAKIEVQSLIRQPEFFEHDGNFPERSKRISDRHKIRDE